MAVEMSTAARQRIAAQRKEDLYRLAGKAETEGVEILCDAYTGVDIATSGTQRGVCYVVNEAGCSCKGFRVWGRCKHHSLWLDVTGNLDPEPPTPAAPAACPLCHGRGLDPACHGHDAIGGRVWCPCPACGEDAVAA